MTGTQRAAGADVAHSTEPAARLRIERLCVEARIGDHWAPVVTDTSFTVRNGEVLCLVGESGSGKTMTCLAILGLLPRRGVRVASGSVWFQDQDLLRVPRRTLEDIRGKSIGLVPQEPSASLNPAFTIGDQLGEVYRRHEGLSRRLARRRAVEILDEVGIPAAASRMNDYPHQFSGGMCQRVLIAMALASNPAVLIADEPTTALDVTVQAQILDLIRGLAGQYGTSVLLVTHDMGVVADLCDRMVVMYAGQVVESGDTGPVFRRPGHPYTERLLTATTRMWRTGDGGIESFAFIPGSMPRPGVVVTGCRFGPRCLHRRPECGLEEVPLHGAGNGSEVRCIRADELDLTIGSGR